MNYEERYAAYLQAIEEYLSGLFTADKPYARLYESMRYSVLSGGKRIRPVLTLEFARLGGIDWHLALPYACALELVHNYSLIHDDLRAWTTTTCAAASPRTTRPSARRSPSSRRRAAPEAFRLILEAPCMSDSSRVEAALVLARGLRRGRHGRRTGARHALRHFHGEGAGRDVPAQDWRDDLRRGAARVRGLEHERTMRQQAAEYADQLGLAFQIRDDMLDVVGDEQVFGKPIGSDKEEGKISYVDVKGLDGAPRPLRTHGEGQGRRRVVAGSRVPVRAGRPSRWEKEIITETKAHGRNRPCAFVCPKKFRRAERSPNSVKRPSAF